MSLTEKAEGLVEQYRAVKEEFRKKCEVVMKEMFVEFFEQNPKIECVTWTQYTPYFMDGDVCVFGVNNFSFLESETDAENCNHGEYYADDPISAPGYFQYVYPREEDKNIRPYTDYMKTMNELLCSEEMSEVMLSTFGDHCKVVAKRDGTFEVNEYEHD